LTGRILAMQHCRCTRRIAKRGQFMSGYVNAMRRYFEFSGRSSRSEFWFYVLLYVVIYIVASILDAIIFGRNAGGVAVLTSLVALVHLVPSISVSVRRLHDIDRTGWWILLGFVPAVAMVVLLGGSMFMMFAGGGDEPQAAGWAAMGVSMLIVCLIALAVAIVLIVFYCTPGTAGANRFGPPPEV
jgi:uncharacterized membrane protein YhaH (DUF805 family)